MRYLRRTTVAAVAAVTLVAGAPPAAAETAVTAATFEGEMTIGCFGCGTYGPGGNSANLRLYGVYDNVWHVGTSGSATFTVYAGTGIGCVVSDYADGSVNVGGDVRDLEWTRLGAYLTLEISEFGRHTILGSGVLKVSSDSALPCGGSVTAIFAGELYGGTT